MRSAVSWSTTCAVLALVAAVLVAPSSAQVDAGTPARGGYLHIIRPDRRPPLVGTRDQVESLFGLPGESVRADGIAEARRDELEALVRRFTPTLVLPRGDHVRRDGRTFQLFPVHPLLMADTLRVDRIAAAPYALRTSSDVPFRTAPPESLRALVTGSVEYRSDPDDLVALYFDFPGDNPHEWWDAYAVLRAGPDSAAWSAPVVFAHPFVAGDGGWFIQYWYFYPFNDYIGNHEGDWEHVCVGLSADRSSVASVHYFFHNHSVVLPAGRETPELVDGTHPVVYVGGRGYVMLDYPIRLFKRERNSGSHGCYPFAGEWEGAGGLGTTESVSGAGDDSLRVVAHDRFRVVLTPEPGGIDFPRRPEVLKEWAWFLMPVRWGFPSAPSLGSSIQFADAGNQAPFGPAYNAGWNRTAPGLSYPLYPVRRLSALRSRLEDLVQPWYYLYAFRTPRFVPDARGDRSRRDLEDLGGAPRSGGAERGIGTTLFGASAGLPHEALREDFGTSIGFLLWRNFWIRGRVGPIELLGGYQKFRSRDDAGGSMFIYPLTANVALRAPDALLRPYVTLGAGAYGWEARFSTADPDVQGVTSGWRLGGTAALGIEYYLRPRVALDLSVRYHDAASPGPRAGLGDDRLRFVTVQAGHYLRF